MRFFAIVINETMEIGTTQNVLLDWEKAGIGERFLALLIDTAILTGIIILLTFLKSYTPDWLYFLTVSMLLFFYFMLMEIFNHGQTFGKNIMKIRVVASSGEKAGVYQYIIRNLIRPVDYLFGLGLVVMIATEQSQRLGDLAAATVVIKLEKEVTYEETVHEVLDEDYQPVFKKYHVEKLTPRNIELIKTTVDDCLRNRRYEAVSLLYLKVKKIMDVEEDTGLNHIEFLQSAVKDFNYYEM